MDRQHPGHLLHPQPFTANPHTHNPHPRCHVDRLTFSVLWEVDDDANILATCYTHTMRR